MGKRNTPTDILKDDVLEKLISKRRNEVRALSVLLKRFDAKHKSFQNDRDNPPLELDGKMDKNT